MRRQTITNDAHGIIKLGVTTSCFEQWLLWASILSFLVLIALFWYSQGASCFDYSSSLQLLVTGGKDRKIRLWSRYVTFSPLAALRGHRASVMDVAIYPAVGQIFSYSRDSVSLWRLKVFAQKCPRFSSFVIMLGAEGLGRFHSRLSKNDPAAVSMRAARSHPRTRRFSLPAAEPPFSSSFGRVLQRLPGSLPLG